VDTLFKKSDNAVAKLHKGHLFLNLKTKRGYWSSAKISLDKDADLNWECFNLDDDITYLEDISKNLDVVFFSEEDSIFVLQPTLIEFEKFIQDPDNMMVCETLIRIQI